MKDRWARALRAQIPFAITLVVAACVVLPVWPCRPCAGMGRFYKAETTCSRCEGRGRVRLIPFLKQAVR